jgi:DNA invertase Pin-like site-specific DNA recombinase
MRTMKTVSLYARVSTKHGQDPETQLQQLREYAANRGLTVAAEYVDRGVSGAKDTRPQLDTLMADASAGRFDGVLCWKFDRFARSTRHLVSALEEFQSLGIHFVSLTEAIDTSTPMGRMVFTVLGAVAELERSLIVERVNAGLTRAKRQGKTLGRPRVIVDREKVSQLATEGLSVRAIAGKLGLTKSTVHNLLSDSEWPQLREK